MNSRHAIEAGHWFKVAISSRLELNSFVYAFLIGRRIFGKQLNQFDLWQVRYKRQLTQPTQWGSAQNKHLHLLLIMGLYFKCTSQLHTHEAADLFVGQMQNVQFYSRNIELAVPNVQINQVKWQRPKLLKRNYSGAWSDVCLVLNYIRLTLLPFRVAPFPAYYTYNGILITHIVIIISTNSYFRFTSDGCTYSTRISYRANEHIFNCINGIVSHAAHVDAVVNECVHASKVSTNREFKSKFETMAH